MEQRLCPYQYGIKELQETAWKLSRQIIRMTTKAGSGHPSSSLSAIDILVAIYFGGIMCYKPDQPDWIDRDRFILSKGHAAPALYAVLAEAGYFDAERLMTLREIGSPVEGLPTCACCPAWKPPPAPWVRGCPSESVKNTLRSGRSLTVPAHA